MIIPPPATPNGKEVESPKVRANTLRESEVPPPPPPTITTETPSPPGSQISTGSGSQISSGSGSHVVPVRGAKPPPPANKEDSNAKAPTLKMHNGGKSTLSRPKTAGGKRATVQITSFNVINRENPVLKSVIKQQAAEQKVLQAKRDLETDKKKKQHQAEHSKFTGSYQNQLQTFAKQHSAALANYQKQCQKEIDTLQKKHQAEEKAIIADQLKERAKLDKEVSTQQKTDLKEFHETQKPIIKQQKIDLKDTLYRIESGTEEGKGWTQTSKATIRVDEARAKAHQLDCRAAVCA